MTTPKRARQKQNREAALAQRAAEERRRRIVRLSIGAVILGAVVLLAFLTAGDDGPAKRNPGAGRTPAPSPSSAVACGGPSPPPAQPRQYDEPPPLELDEGVDYQAVVDTSCGLIKLDLFERNAKTVANFVFLAREGFYEGLLWHRVERGSVIQTGDPNGQTGVPPDGPGYSIPDEPPKRASVYVYGVVGMANAGPNTGGSQFFVVTHDREKRKPQRYPPNYAILGHVSEGSFDVIDLISSQKTPMVPDPAEAVKPIDPVYINSIEIIEA